MTQITNLWQNQRNVKTYAGTKSDNREQALENGDPLLNSCTLLWTTKITQGKNPPGTNSRSTGPKI